jgi:hypothetical protein
MRSQESGVEQALSLAFKLIFVPPQLENCCRLSVPADAQSMRRSHLELVAALKQANRTDGDVQLKPSLPMNQRVWD